jgi:hypothetical protein
MLAVGFVLLLGWLLIGPLWERAGIANTADGILHLHRSAEVARAWTEGVLWPRWFPGAYQGLGAPIFHYYSPLFYVLVAPLHLPGFPLDTAAKLIISGLFITSGLAVYAWLRRLAKPRSKAPLWGASLSAPAGLAGAALYLSSPHFFREYYFQGDYLFWLPVVLWAFTCLYLDGRWRNWLLAALSLAVLATAHNITAMLGGALLALYWLALPLWRRSWQGWWRGPAAVMLGVGLSAFFWMPALGDIPLVRVNTLRESFFHYSQYFVYPSDLLAAPPPLDSRAVNPPFPYMLGWAAWLALAAGCLVIVLALVRRVKGLSEEKFQQQRQFPDIGCTFARRRSVWAAVGIVISVIFLALTQAWSAPAWEKLPGISLLQFPGRMLGPAAVGVTLAGGAVVCACGKRWVSICLAGAVLAVALSSSVFLFPPQPFLRITGYTEAETQAWERASGNWGTTSSNGYLPRWAEVPGAYAGQEVQARVLPAGASWTWETPHRAVLRAADGASLPAGPLTLPVHYFPAWRVLAGNASFRSSLSRPCRLNRLTACSAWSYRGRSSRSSWCGRARPGSAAASGSHASPCWRWLPGWGGSSSGVAGRLHRERWWRPRVTPKARARCCHPWRYCSS